MHYLVYQLTNIINGKVYIGVHQTTNPDDGYMGSGTVLKRSLAKHGETAFKKEILFNFSTPEEMFNKERELVTEEFVKRPDTYNLRVGGFGGWDYVNASGKNNFGRTDESRKGVRAGGKKGAAIMRHKMQTDSEFAARVRTNLSLAMKRYYEVNAAPWTGRKHTQETIAKQKAIAQSRNVVGAANPMYGRRWMNNGVQSKPVLSNVQQSLLTLGWKYGKIQMLS